MKKNILKRSLSLLLAFMLIISCFTGCSSAPKTIHPVMTYDGESYYYGMEIDVDKFLEKYPKTQISGLSYAINQYVSISIRNVDGKDIVVAYFISGNCGAKINGVSVDDDQKNYLNTFENSTVISNDGTGTNYILGFYVYEEKYISKNKFDQYLTAKRFEGTDAYNEYLANVCLGSALTNGTHITSMYYGDYNAIYFGI